MGFERWWRRFREALARDSLRVARYVPEEGVALLRVERRLRRNLEWRVNLQVER